MKRLLAAMAVLLCAAVVVSLQWHTGPAPHPPSSDRSTPSSRPGTTADPTPTPPDALFDDEFDGPAGAAPDPLSWSYDTGYGWDNGTTSETYTAGRANSALDGQGHLVITALADPSAQGGHTSARLQSRATWFRPGTAVLVRLRTDAYEPGAWPAAWTLGEPEAQWPRTGEVDVFEDWWEKGSFTPQYHVHTATSDAGAPYAGVDPTQWHVYEARWTGGTMAFLLDGRLLATERYDARASSDLLLNVAVGGVGGTPAAPWHPFRMYVDYIRVVPG